MRTSARVGLVLVGAFCLVAWARESKAAGSTRVVGSEITGWAENGSLRFGGTILFEDEGLKRATVSVRFSIQSSGGTPTDRRVGLSIQSIARVGGGYVAQGMLTVARVAYPISLPLATPQATAQGERYAFHHTFTLAQAR